MLNKECYVTNVVFKGDSGEKLNLWRISKDPSSYGFMESSDKMDCKYNPEVFPAMVVSVKNKGTVNVFGTGKFICTAPSEEQGVEAIKSVFKALAFSGLTSLASLKYEVVNVVAVGSISKEIGCGIVRSIFSEAKMSSFGGGSILIRNGGTLRIFASGKIVGTGFKSKVEALRRINMVIKKIEENYDRFQITRLKHCELERYNPASESYWRLVDELGSKHNFDFSIEEKALGEELLTKFLRKTRNTQMGMAPESLGRGIVYVLSVLTGKRLTQREIVEFSGSTDITIRKAAKHIVRVLELPFDVSLHPQRERYCCPLCSESERSLVLLMQHLSKEHNVKNTVRLRVSHFTMDGVLKKKEIELVPIKCDRYEHYEVEVDLGFWRETRRKRRVVEENVDGYKLILSKEVEVSTR